MHSPSHCHTVPRNKFKTKLTTDETLTRLCFLSNSLYSTLLLHYSFLCWLGAGCTDPPFHDHTAPSESNDDNTLDTPHVYMDHLPVTFTPAQVSLVPHIILDRLHHLVARVSKDIDDEVHLQAPGVVTPSEERLTHARIFWASVSSCVT